MFAGESKGHCLGSGINRAEECHGLGCALAVSGICTVTWQLGWRQYHIFGLLARVESWKQTLTDVSLEWALKEGARTFLMLDGKLKTKYLVVLLSYRPALPAAKCSSACPLIPSLSLLKEGMAHLPTGWGKAGTALRCVYLGVLAAKPLPRAFWNFSPLCQPTEWWGKHKTSYEETQEFLYFPNHT